MLRGTQDAPPSAPRAPRACALLPTGRGRELRQDARLQQLRPARVTSHNASCVGSSMPPPPVSPQPHREWRRRRPRLGSLSACPGSRRKGIAETEGVRTQERTAVRTKSRASAGRSPRSPPEEQRPVGAGRARWGTRMRTHAPRCRPQTPPPRGRGGNVQPRPGFPAPAPGAQQGRRPSAEGNPPDPDLQEQDAGGAALPVWGRLARITSFQLVRKKAEQKRSLDAGIVAPTRGCRRGSRLPGVRPRFCSSWRLINVTLLVSIETATFF